MTKRDLSEWFDHVRKCSACQYQVNKSRKNILDHLTELQIEPRDKMKIHIKECRKCFCQSFKIQWLISVFYFELKVKKFLNHFKFWY